MITLIATLHQELLDKMDKLPNIIQRTQAFIEIDQKVSIAIGMRRVGKTYMMFSKIKRLLKEGLSPQRLLYIDFEDDRLLPLSQKSLSELLDAFYAYFPGNHDHTCYLFLDEIQNVPDWALVIRRFLNTKSIKIYLSGSSAKLLSKEIATSLRGRSIVTEVWPYSFKEFIVAKCSEVDELISSQKVQDKLQKLLNEYFERGGFPGILDQDKLNQTRVLQEYINVVIYRDIVERHEVQHVRLIKYMILYLLKNIASNLSINKFYNDIKSQGYAVSRSTVGDYLAYIEDAYLIFTVPLYSESIRKRQTNPKKLYAIDSGICNAVSMSLNEHVGRLLENLVYIDLRRRGDEIYYYLTESRYEVDFLTRSLDGNLHLYQVTLDMSDESTRQREQRALDEAEEELGIKGHIITLEAYTQSFDLPV